MRKLLLLLLLPVLLVAAFLLYSVLKVKGTPSIVFQPATGTKERMLYRHVEELSVTIGSRSVFEYDRLLAAKEYILASLRGMGHTPVLQDVPYQDRTYSNIIVTLPGKTRPGDVVVIGAHYDTVGGSPGADDNASAVAVLLEMARRLKDHPPDRTLKLLFFTLEEPPVFRTESMGSFVYARDARNRQERIRAMVCLEMLGYYSDREGGQSFPLPFMSLLFPSTPNFIAVVGNFASRSLVNAVSDSLRAGCSVPVETLTTLGFVPGVDFSDHRSFWKMGYPAVMVTDTAFYRNPNYHRETDRIDTLDFNRLSALLEGLVAMAKDLSRSGSGED
ncbi:MAG: M28 family peptidase [Thermodesulfobacteriota bacterium]